jgi:F-type H+-transporting ATPase subunit b
MDKNFLLQIGNFLVLAAVLFFVLKKPAQSYFESRARSLKNLVDETRKAYETAMQERDALALRLKQVESETVKLVKSFEEEGLAEKQRILEDAREYAQKIKEDAKRIADSEIKRTKEELKIATIRMSQDLAVKLVAQEITDADEDKLNEGFIKSL